MDKSLEKIYALLVDLHEKVDKQEKQLNEISQALKKQSEKSHEPKKMAIVTTQPLGGVFAKSSEE